MSHPGDEHNTLTVTKAITTEGDALRALRGAARAKSYLEAGFTTVRDLGNSGKFADVALKRAIDEGTVVGPRLYVSGPGLAPEGGQAPDLLHGQTSLINGDYRIIRGTDDARTAVREHVYFGVDLIKIYSNSSPNKTFLSIDEMKAIVEEAHLYNLKVTAHATNDLAIIRAVQAGVDAIEHGYVASDSTFQLMKRNNVIMVPTDMDFLMAKKQIEKLKMNLNDQEIIKLATPYHDRLKRAKKAGIVIAAGSDMYMDLGLPRGEAAKRVLFAYQEAGISLLEILQSATVHAARLIGEEKLGVLKKGSFADIVAIDGAPLENITALEKVVFVMKNGVIYKPITK
jgi:imidazolonepropionase-like amidohydrolase